MRQHRLKITSLLLSLLLIIYGVSATAFPKQAQAQIQLCHYADIGCLLGNLGSIIGALTNSGDVATTDKEAECSDNVMQLTGDAKAINERRSTGKVLGCRYHDIQETTAHYSVAEEVSVSIFDSDHKTDAELEPSEKIAGEHSGYSISEASGVTYQDQRFNVPSYLGENYVNGTEDKRIVQLEDGEPEYVTLNRAGVYEKMAPYMCGDETCDDKLRKEVLGGIVIGYKYAQKVRDALHLPIEELDGDIFGPRQSDLALMAKRDGVSDKIQNDYLLGYIHSKSVAAGEATCDGSPKSDIAFSTESLGVPCEYPVYASRLIPMIDMNVEGMDDGEVKQILDVVLGPQAANGILAPDSLMALQLNATGANPLATALPFCGNNCEWATGGSVNAQPCEKLGVNFAAAGSPDDYQHVARLKMGRAVELITDWGQWSGLVGRFNLAIKAGITPVLRICYGDSCAFKDVNEYIRFINTLAEAVDGEFYVIAGPNEPNSEHWLATPTEIATYMNAVIAGVSSPNVKVLSPAFNLTYEGLEADIVALQAAGANFAGLDGIAGNAYNIGGQRMSNYVDRLRATGIANGRKIVLTEAGAFLDKGSRAQQLVEIKEEVANLTAQPDVVAINFFNMFNTNKQFHYHAMTDQEYAEISTACVGGGSATAGANPALIPVKYYEAPKMNTFANTSKLRTPDIGSKVVEKTNLDFSLDTIINGWLGRTDGTRESLFSYGGIPTGKEITQKVASFLLPHAIVEACGNDEYTQELPDTINESDKQYATDAQVVDVIVPPADLGRDGDAPVYKGVDQIPDYEFTDRQAAYRQDPTAPTSFDHTVSRPLEMKFGIHADMEKAIRHAMHTTCGLVRTMTEYSITNVMDEKLENTDVTIATKPTYTSYTDCPEDGDSTCSRSDVPSAFTGGVNAFLNGCNGPDCEKGLHQCRFLLHGARGCEGGSDGKTVSEEIHDLAQKAEELKFARAPWLELASYKNQPQDIAQEEGTTVASK